MNKLVSLSVWVVVAYKQQHSASRLVVIEVIYSFICIRRGSLIVHVRNRTGEMFQDAITTAVTA